MSHLSNQQPRIPTHPPFEIDYNLINNNNNNSSNNNNNNNNNNSNNNNNNNNGSNGNNTPNSNSSSNPITPSILNGLNLNMLGSPASLSQNNNNNNSSSSSSTYSPSNNPHFSSPYQRPLSLTKDKIPLHLQHYMNTPVATSTPYDRDFDPEIREVTPANITLRNTNTTTTTNNNNNNNSAATTTTTTTTSPNNNNSNNNNSNNINFNNNSTSNNNNDYSNNNNNNNNNEDDSDEDGSSPTHNSNNNNNNNQAIQNISSSNALVTTDNRQLVEANPTYIEITEFLNFPQSEAAKKLGIPTSTLSKRWKEAARGRKWPFRKISKIDKEIMTLLHNIPPGEQSSNLPPAIDQSLVNLLKKRQNELKPVFIRM